jgi:hypothetical protein
MSLSKTKSKNVFWEIKIIIHKFQKIICVILNLLVWQKSCVSFRRTLFPIFTAESSSLFPSSSEIGGLEINI